MIGGKKLGVCTMKRLLFTAVITKRTNSSQGVTAASSASELMALIKPQLIALKFGARISTVTCQKTLTFSKK